MRALIVHTDEFARLRNEPADLLFRLRDHEVDIKRDPAQLAQLLYVVCAEHQVGHEHAVHHIHMQVFDPALFKGVKHLFQFIDRCAHH